MRLPVLYHLDSFCRIFYVFAQMFSRLGLIHEQKLRALFGVAFISSDQERQCSYWRDKHYYKN